MKHGPDKHKKAKPKHKKPKAQPQTPLDPRPAKFDTADLTVITSYFNPAQYDSRPRLHRAFEAHMKASGVRLITVECALRHRPFEVTHASNPDHVQVRTNSVLWVKESLINLGLARVAHDCLYIAWIDGDIHFRDPHWATETVHALQHYDIVQPWSECYDLGPKGEHLALHRSFARQHKHGVPRGKNYEFAHPGYAWAARRDAIDKVGGLIDFAILGAGDHHIALAIVGEARSSVPQKISPAYLKHVLGWQDRAQIAFDSGNLGYLQGTIEHGFHGVKADRRYISRWDIITQNNFDPDVDIRRNLYGIYELTGNKPRLRDQIDHYFRQRNEDINSV